MASVSDRADALCARFDLPDGASAQLVRLLELVEAEPIALTSVRDPARAIDVHVADSLAGLDLAEVRAAATIADLGAGAGFPGLVLAIGLPSARVTLVESVAKKAGFLERATRDLRLANVDVVTARVEGWSAGAGTQDVVTARALAPLAVLLEYAAPLLRVSGVLVAWKGRRDAQEEADADVAAAVLAMSPPEHHRVNDDLVPGADERHLYLSSKVGPTPTGYPRRVGMARKRPLEVST